MWFKKIKEYIGNYERLFTLYAYGNQLDGF